MAGHSKWANIRFKKERADAKRGKIFTKLIKEITVAARMGGSDASTNARLRLAIERGKGENLPQDNIERAIKRGSGNLDGVNYEAIRYEGYGVAGAAVIIDTLTDNRNRTVGEIRHALTKFGGNLGTDGCVSYLFRHCGQFILPPCQGDALEALTDLVIANGADDIIESEDGSIEIICELGDFFALNDALSASVFDVAAAEVLMKPLVELDLSESELETMQKVIDVVESLDDVQNVYSNVIF